MLADATHDLGRERGRAAAAFRQRGIASLRIPALCRALRSASPGTNGIAFYFKDTP